MQTSQANPFAKYGRVGSLSASTFLSVLLFGILVISNTAVGQEPPSDNDKTASSTQATADDEPEVKEFAEQYDERFLNRDPKIGTELADMEAFDADGLPFDFRTTRGSYTVIVFGCLT